MNIWQARNTASAKRCAGGFAMAALVGTVAAVSCSEPTKHRVMTFFLDGVPELGSTPTVGYEPLPRRVFRGGEGGAGEVRRAVVIRAHEPFRKNRCGKCHNSQTHELFRTPAEGLCQGCHTNVPGDVRYVHGPVAVRACLFCHHHHGTPHAYLLRSEPKQLCLKCHERGDLGVGVHHGSLETQDCTECHHAHGEDNRFFLKRIEP